LLLKRLKFSSSKDLLAEEFQGKMKKDLQILKEKYSKMRNNIFAFVTLQKTTLTEAKQISLFELKISLLNHRK